MNGGRKKLLVTVASNCQTVPGSVRLRLKVCECVFYTVHVLRNWAYHHTLCWRKKKLCWMALRKASHNRGRGIYSSTDLKFKSALLQWLKNSKSANLVHWNRSEHSIAAWPTHLWVHPTTISIQNSFSRLASICFSNALAKSSSVTDHYEIRERPLWNGHISRHFEPRYPLHILHCSTPCRTIFLLQPTSSAEFETHGLEHQSPMQKALDSACSFAGHPAVLLMGRGTWTW